CDRCSLVVWRQVWVMLVWLLLLPKLTLADEDCHPWLSTTQQNLTVATGRQARLTCVVDNLRHYKVAWTHYGPRGRAVLTVDTQVITKNQRVSLVKEQGGTTWSLVITNITTSDGGLYLCQLNTVPPHRLYFHLHVVASPVIVRPPDDAEAVEGQDVVLECEATGDPVPTLTWRRDTPVPISLNQSQDAPEIVGGVGVVWAEVTGCAALVCEFRGWPRPTVAWTRDRRLIESSLDQWDMDGTGRSSLVFKSITTEDFGLYTCTVSNLLGSRSTLLTLLEVTTTTSSTTITTTTTTTTTTTST
ncbi:hypothetical protein OTU49_012757, partial [Cherax quadricarinatus]